MERDAEEGHAAHEDEGDQEEAHKKGEDDRSETSCARSSSEGKLGTGTE